VIKNQYKVKPAPPPKEPLPARYQLWQAPLPSREIQVNAPGVPMLECIDVPN